MLLLCDSYMYASPEGDRISQRTNPELTIEPTTGLKYLDEIAQLKNVTGSLNSCTNQISSCPVVLCNITLPTSTNITLSSNYDTFNTIDIPIPALTNTTSCNITSSGKYCDSLNSHLSICTICSTNDWDVVMSTKSPPYY